MEESQPHPSHNSAIEVTLAEAFSPPPALTQPLDEGAISSKNSEIVAVQTESEKENAADVTNASDTSWKADYDAHVATWRAESAVAREKAEKERQRWEAVRAKEKEEAVGQTIVNISTRGHLPHEAEWETVSNANTNPAAESRSVSQTASSSFASIEDFPARSAQNQVVAHASSSARKPPDGPVTQPQSTHEPCKWEGSCPLAPSLPPPNATLAIFDNSLSRPTRIKAVLASLAINLFLPFVNGVMLGFGEIFAKNVVLEWFGWKSSGPGSLASMTGMSSDSRSPWSRPSTPEQ